MSFSLFIIDAFVKLDVGIFVEVAIGNGIGGVLETICAFVIEVDECTATLGLILVSGMAVGNGGAGGFGVMVADERIVLEEKIIVLL